MATKCLAVIPCRGGSKGVPRKNILDLGGLPLVVHSIKAAQESKFITRAIVSTDDEEISEVAKKYGGDVPFARPANLATDTARSVDVCVHVLNECIRAGEDYDYFVFTGGIKGFTLHADKTYEVNKLNQYITDDYLHLKGEQDIFVVGDVAQVIYKDEYLAPTAQLAIKAGEYVGTFIQNDIANKPRNIFNIFVPKLNGTLISLGGSYAVALVFNKFFIKGILAHLLKKFVTRTHKRKFA